MKVLKRTPGYWEVDTIDNDGEYGDGGPDTHSGFKSYAVYDEKGRVLFDSLNSDATEVSEEYSDDEFGGGHYAWDSVAEANLTFAAAAPHMAETLEIVLEREQITSATRALIEHTLRRAKGG